MPFNMPRTSCSADSDKVKNAVKVLIRAPTLSVPEAMKLADFSAEECADPTLRRHIQRALPGGSRKRFRTLVVKLLLWLMVEEKSPNSLADGCPNYLLLLITFLSHLQFLMLLMQVQL